MFNKSARRRGGGVALLAALLGALGLLRAEAARPAPRPAPGQLQILGKDGRPAGLCPLKHTDVQADISGYVARVTVTQDFENPSAGPVEAVYTFPLPDAAAVDDMTMTLGDRVVRGEIRRRAEARAIYEAAKSQGQAAALLDQERPNIFTQSVANILPGQGVRITIRYVHLLKYDDGRYEWTFPMVVGPRYVTAATPDADKVTPPVTPPGTRAGHDISLRVALDAGLPLGAVQSVLHPVDVERDGPTRAVIQLQNQDEIPNKDFVLRYMAAGAHLQSGMLTCAPAGENGGGYFTLIVQPPLAPPRAQISRKEVVFVIDQTGSQAGWPLEKAKETMRHCIAHLNPGDTFQLLAFNTEVHPCFTKPVLANPVTLARADAFLKPLQGNGGTDILKAADYALHIPDDPDRLRIVCYMTDGYVGNDMQIIDYIAKHRGRARMFPFGVGDGVNRFLIDGMAREGRGAAEYVTLDEDGAEAADRFARRIADPILLDVGVDWGGLPVADVYPRHIPDVFSQGPIIVKGRYTHPGEGDIVVHGVLRGRPWQQTLHVVFPASQADGGAIATLWAREKIEDLQNQDWVGAQTGHPVPDIQAQIVDTALKYRLMSQWTSFVAVEQRVVNVGGRQRTIDVPVEMPEGVSYEGVFGAEEDQSRSTGGTFGGSRLLAAGHAMHAAKSAVGGYGGGGYGFALPASPAVVPAPTVNGRERVDAALDQANAPDDSEDIRAGTAAGQKRLAALGPVARVALLRRVKLAPALAGSAGAAPVTVQVWLNTLPPGGLARLRALGFRLDATLTPDKLLLGEIGADKLDALLALPWVRRVEPPRFR